MAVLHDDVLVIASFVSHSCAADSSPLESSALEASIAVAEVVVSHFDYHPTGLLPLVSAVETALQLGAEVPHYLTHLTTDACGCR